MSLESALAYRERGWSPVPIPHRGKRPIIQWKIFQTKIASEGEIRGWWESTPTYGVGIVTGRVSGLVVVDIDPRNGGLESWLDWEERYGRFPTLSVKSGGGGFHYYYRHPDGDPVGKREGFLKGVDISAEGAQVVAPPSVHASGVAYEWADEEFGVAELPPPLLEQLRGKAQRPPVGDSAKKRRGLTMEEVFDGADIPEGNRDVLLTQIAGFLAAAADAYAPVYAQLTVVNQKRCKPPLPDADVERIAQSIWGSERRQRDMRGLAGQVLRGEEPVPDDQVDRLSLAAEVWEMVGVPGVVDWVIQREGEDTEYVVHVGYRTARFLDLLRHDYLRRSVMNAFGRAVRAKAELKKEGVEWDRLAEILWKTARLEVLDGATMRSRAEGWIAQFAQRMDLGMIPGGVDFEGDLERVSSVEPRLRDGVLRSQPILVSGKLTFYLQRLLRYVQTHLGEDITAKKLRAYLTAAGYSRTIVAPNIAVWQADHLWQQPKTLEEDPE